MNKDFIPFELAVKFKEKGFTKETAHHYNDKGEICVSLVGEEYPYPCPTISQVLKWLREEKKIHISIDIYDDGWFFDITFFYKEDTGVYACTIPYLASNVTPDFDSYEQAALAGISYVLDNLI